LRTLGCSKWQREQSFHSRVIVRDEKSLVEDLATLRERILRDPYFTDVPSVKLLSKKTAFQFHAKDDIPEIRRDVFSLLRQHDLIFHAVIRDKTKIMDYVRQENERNAQYRYNQNELYDSLVRRLFEGLLQTNDMHKVTFASRGNADRTRALAKAIQADLPLKIAQHRSVDVVACRPNLAPALQAVDYYLWSLQRLYERGEDRYWNYVSPHAKLIMDLDDTRRFPSGVRYTQKEPLTLVALKKVSVI
jgi:hypothetical protein